MPLWEFHLSRALDVKLAETIQVRGTWWHDTRATFANIIVFMVLVGPSKVWLITAEKQLINRCAEIILGKSYCGEGIVLLVRWKQKQLRKEEKAYRTCQCQQVPKLKQARIFLEEFDTKQFQELITLPRNKFRQLEEIYTGNCSLRCHLHRLGHCSTDLCRFCDQINRWQHFKL